MAHPDDDSEPSAQADRRLRRRNQPESSIDTGRQIPRIGKPAVFCRDRDRPVAYCRGRDWSPRTAAAVRHRV